MDFKNRRSKLYSIGGMVLGLGAIIPNVIVFFGKNGDLTRTFMLINIGQFFLGLLFALLGTQSVFANRKKRLGYLYYLVAVSIFVVLFTRM